MNLVDWIIIIILIFFAVRGFSRGFLQGIAGLVGVIVALVLAVQFMDDLSSILLHFFSLSPRVAVLLTAVIIFFVVFLGFIFTAKFLRSVLKMAALGWVDRIAGTALGLVKGAVIVSIVALMISLIPFRGKAQAEFDQSLLFRPAQRIAPMVFDAISKGIPIAGDFYDELKQSLTDISGDISVEALKWLDTLKQKNSNQSQF